MISQILFFVTKKSNYLSYNKSYLVSVHLTFALKKIIIYASVNFFNVSLITSTIFANNYSSEYASS